MSTDLSLALAAISIAISGDPVAGKWSIGGAFPATLGLLGQPSGIVGTHNRYEGDASIVRVSQVVSAHMFSTDGFKGDAYMHGGSVGFFEMHRWERLYGLAASKGGLTHDKVASQAYYTAQYSIQNNPYYFSNPFSGLVAPDAHNFVVHVCTILAYSIHRQAIHRQFPNLQLLLRFSTDPSLFSSCQIAPRRTRVVS